MMTVIKIMYAPTVFGGPVGLGLGVGYGFVDNVIGWRTLSTPVTDFACWTTSNC